MHNNKKNILLIVGILTLLTGIIAITYAASTYIKESKENKISTGYITFTYDEKGNELKITNGKGISDDNGKILNDYFDFSISSKATGTVDVGYYIYLIPTSVNGAQLDNSAVKVYLSSVINEDDPIANEQARINPTKISDLVPFNTETLTYDENAQNYLIYSSLFNFANNDTTTTHYYRLRIWLDENYKPQYSTTNNGNSQTATLEDGEYKLKINIISTGGKPKTIVKQ